MKLVDLLLLLLFVGGGSYASFRLVQAALGSGNRAKQVANAKWQHYHSSHGENTEIGVRKLVSFNGNQPQYEAHIIAAIADEDPSYDSKFLEAMWEAKQRAATLQLETPLPS